MSTGEWVGVSFSTIERYRITGVGAHVGGSGQLVFSIFETNGTLPESAPDLNNAVAYTTVTAPFPSEDLHVPFEFVLRPGNWALLINTSPLSAGFVPANNVDIGPQTYIESTGTFEVSALDSMRFYLEGALIPQACGNGWHDTGEDCDGDNNGTAGEGAFCDTDCTFAWCGDGTTNTTIGELCDDGADNGTPAHCDSECKVPGIECGNGRTDLGEACDDGNVSNRDACLNSCESATCGDGHVRVDVEECDDGNASERDACTIDCTIREPSPTPSTKGTNISGCSASSRVRASTSPWAIAILAALAGRRKLRR